MMKRILIIDDDIAVTNYLMVFFMQTEQFESTIINDSREVAGYFDRETYDILLLDMDMPNISGIDILKEMQRRELDTPVVVLTGVSDVDLAVKAMKLGAFDYLMKPVDDDQLLEVLHNAMEHGELHHTIEQLPGQLKREDLVHESAFKRLTTGNPEMIRIFYHAEKMADSDLCIFIWGENGTGKETLARAIHEASPRGNKPFIAVEIDSHDPEKLPASFFGQAKDWSGSREDSPGLLEEAAGGTLFINHIESLSPPMQVRLNRVIQTGEYYWESSARVRNIDVRFIVASTHDLMDPEYKDKFSQDLLYHIVINSIKIPPLRERVDDIECLAKRFLKKYKQKAGKTISGFSGDLLELLKNYTFPGNVQELKTIISSSVANEETDLLTVDSLSCCLSPVFEPERRTGDRQFLPRKLEEVIKQQVILTLDHFKQDGEKAAEVLGISIEELDRICK